MKFDSRTHEYVKPDGTRIDAMLIAKHEFNEWVKISEFMNEYRKDPSGLGITKFNLIPVCFYNY